MWFAMHASLSMRIEVVLNVYWLSRTY